MKFKVKLRLIDGNGKKHKYSLNLEEGSKFTLGRGTPGIGAELNHPTVSTAHAHLHIKDGVLHVLDNKSRNGTRLNGKSVQTAAVRVGDMLQLGVCQIEFLEAPNPPIEENPASTRFIDVNELSPEDAKAMGRNKEEERAPEPTMAMSRKGLDEILDQTGSLAMSSQTDEAPSTDERPRTEEAPRDYANDAYAPPAPAIPGELGEAPPIPDRPQFSGEAASEALPGDDVFRSVDSFGRGREGEYRREDDPRYNPDARNRRASRAESPVPEPRKQKRVSDRETDTIAKPVKAARSSMGGKIDPHVLVSSLMALVSTAAAATLLSIGKKTYAPWVTPVAGIVGTLLVYSLAWLLHKYNEFMEAEGETKEYYRFLAYSTVALVPTSLLTNTAFMWRLAAFIGLGIAFFHLFMARFRPVAEKFVFIVGSYVSVLAFAGYLVNGQVAGTNQGKPPRIAQTPEQEENREPAEEVQPEGQQPEGADANPQTPAPSQTQAAAPEQAEPEEEEETQADAPQGEPQKIEAPTEKQADKSKPGGPDSFAISQLYKAAEHGDTAIVRKLVREKGVNPNTVAENGVTALMLAAYYGHVETAKFLLSEKADINLKDRQGTTALMWAVLKGNRDMVGVLVQAGAELSARRNDGDTALEIARMWHYNDIVRILDKNAKTTAASSPSNPRKPSSQPQRRAQPKQPSRPQKSRPKPARSKKSARYSATEQE